MENVFFYHCKKCGNVVMTLKECECNLTCCEDTMEKLEANTVEAVNEKHLPVATVEDNKIKVTVGSVYHPMNTDHYIQWIAIVIGEKFEMVHLSPAMLPKAIFTYESWQDEDPLTSEDNEFLANCEGQPCNFVYNDNPVIKVKAYAYCNLHGLWETEIEY